MNRLLVLLILVLTVGLVTAQSDSGRGTPADAELLGQYRAELESGFILMQGEPFAQDLPHPLVVIGSNLDALEQQYYPLILTDYPDVPRIPDTETSYGGRSIYEYNLILVGGPKHNQVSKQLFEHAVFEFQRTTSKPKIVIIGVPNATAAGAGILCGTIYGFDFVPTKWVPIMALLPPEAAPAAAATTGIVLAGLGSKLLAFLKRFFSTAAEEVGEEVLLEKTRDHQELPAGLGKRTILSLSSVELAHLGVSFVLFGCFMAWTESTRSSFLQNLPPYILGAGLVLIVHELVHNFTAHRYGVESEFRIAPVGLLSVAITSLIFGTVFAVPGRTILYGSATEDQHGKIALAGPLVSFVMVILFWLASRLGGFVGSIGLAGFAVAFIMAVYEMLPIRPMDGEEVRSWSRRAWRLYFIPVFLLYAWTFLIV
jgi:Zn-dependent protease